MGSPCLPSPLPVAPPLSPFPTPPRQMEPAPSVRPPRQHSPHLPPPYAQGLACGRCLLGDSEDWLGSDGWELSHVSLRLPQSPPGSPCLVTAALALADCPVPGLDLKSPEGSSQPCVWPLPCPMAWLWVWQASAGEAWGVGLGPPPGLRWAHSACGGKAIAAFLLRLLLRVCTDSHLALLSQPLQSTPRG